MARTDSNKLDELFPEREDHDDDQDNDTDNDHDEGLIEEEEILKLLERDMLDEPRGPHYWTELQERTIMCLIIKGVHRQERGTKKEPALRVEEEFPHQFNTALSRKKIDKDVNAGQINARLAEVLREKKGLIPIIERQRGARVTRGMRMMWERTDKRDFVGDLEEWENGRREVEMKKWRVRMGLEAPGEVELEKVVREDCGKPVANNNQNADITERFDQVAQARGNGRSGTSPPKSRRTLKSSLLVKSKKRSPQSSKSKPKGLSAEFISHSDDEDIDMAVQPPESPSKKDKDLTSFSSLPASLQASDRFAWAKGGGKPVSMAAPIVLTSARKRRR